MADPVQFPGLLTTIRPMLTFLSPAGARGRLSILIYHRVLPAPDPLLPGEVDRETFGWHLDLVSRLFTPLPLSEAVARLRDGKLPSRALCVTFDDGYADNATVALPMLRHAGVPATFFVATDYLDGGMMFNDRIIETVRRMPAGEYDLNELSLGTHRLNGPESRVAAYGSIIGRIKYLPGDEREDVARRFCVLSGGALPGDLMMSAGQVRELRRAGMDIGGHTASHPILSRLDDADALAEMRRGRETLQEILDEPVTLFAYPNGKPGQDYDARHVAMVREAGFEAAVSTASGVSMVSSDPCQLPRFTPWDKTPLRFSARLARNLLNNHPRTA